MPALVYRITEVLSAIVIDLPIGANLGLFHILWTLISGRLLQTRGALIPALAATGLELAVVRRAWAAFADGAWDVSQLIAALRALVRHEGRRHAQHCGKYRVVAHVGSTASPGPAAGTSWPPPHPIAPKPFSALAGRFRPMSGAGSACPRPSRRRLLFSALSCATRPS